jgi:NitT/TauT family transport system ATP-binding protein
LPENKAAEARASVPELVVEGLGFAWGEHRVLDGLSFRVPKGSSLAIVGPSGTGKTTLLHLIGGLLKPGAGSLSLNPAMAPLALMPQSHGLLPWKTLAGNVALGAGLSPRDPGVAAIMGRLGLGGLAQRYPHQVSGGQAQRAALARALLGRPQTLLLDEATSQVDALTRESIQDLFHGAWRELGMTMILVTHSIEEAACLGSSILVLGYGRAELIPNPLPAAAPSTSAIRASAQWLALCTLLRERLAALTPAESGGKGGAI